MSDILELTGLNEEEKRFIRQQTEEKGFKLTKYLQKLIRRGLKEERLEHAIQAYLSRKISISGAAAMAGVSLYEFLEILQSHGYISNYDIEDFQQGLKLLKKQ
ncbi:MAG: UPF0175 family protein [Candidatus Heimdallarchaeota archaeon]